MTDQDPTLIVHDFEKLLRYVAENKIVLTPKQSLFPLRHIKLLTEQFQVKEAHEHRLGSMVYKTRDEMEYIRFYFLDLLAENGGFLKITNKNLLSKGPHWQTFFTTLFEDRGFLLFYAFHHYFDFENWFLRGGDFGEQIENKRKLIWSLFFQCRDGKAVDWKSLAGRIIFDCDIRWKSIDQTCAQDLAIWGLEYCFLKPFEYFGLIEAEKKDGDEHGRFLSFQLNQAGCDYFGGIMTERGKFIAGIAPFSLN